MATIFSLLQIILAVALAGAVLLQAKGSGLSATFGGTAMFYRSRRGIEHFLFSATIVLAIAVALLSMLNIWLTG